jgi:hypothetical protein
MPTQKDLVNYGHLWLLWTLVSSMGLSFGLASAFWITEICLALTDKYPSTFLLYAVVGVWIGIMQWLVLRREVSNPALWVPATIIGVLLSQILDDNFLRISFLRQFWIWDMPNVAFKSMISAISGGILGAIQWVVLRRWVHYSIVWVPVRTGGKAIATLIYVFFFTGFWGMRIGGILAYVGINGGIDAAISALGLIWLFQQPRVNGNRE